MKSREDIYYKKLLLAHKNNLLYAILLYILYERRQPMSTFINIVDKSRGISKEKQEEFKERLITLFRQGGMMEQQIQSLFGKKIITINPVKYDENQNIDFIYNYFEDSLWENSDFNGKTGHVYSRKVGWDFFNFVM